MPLESRKCRFCPKEFYSAFNRIRHEAGIHNRNSDQAAEEMSQNADDTGYAAHARDIYNDNNSEGGGDVSDEEEKEGEESNDDEEMEEDDKSESGTEEESSDDEDDDKAKEFEIWDRVIKEALDGIEDPEIDTVKDVFEDPFLSKLTKGIRKVIDDYNNVVRVIEESNVYVKIDDTKMQFEDKGYEEDEAKAAAWDQRKFLARKLLKDHKAMIEEELFPTTEKVEEDAEKTGEEEEVEMIV